MPPPPSALTENCAPLPEFAGEDAGALVRYVIQIIDLYGECAARHAGLSKASRHDR